MSTTLDPVAPGDSSAAVLTNPAYAALTGPHAEFAEIRGNARRYPSDVAPFLGLPTDPTDQDWADAAELVGSGHTAALMRPDLPIPSEWFKLDRQFDLVQFAAPPSFGLADTELVRLGPDDVPDMLALVALTDPGPFRTRTVALGTYLGLRRDGELIAMAGERFHPPGHVELSAVCTHPDHRGQGLATRLIRAVVAGAEDRGDQAFLHTGGTNTRAIRLYESLGFIITNRMKVTIIQAL
ncbi:FR47-like protein [Kribbella amoyensis]|uniref:FR47-like protein n=1 Tax=Kribbella amoyensis TaxID=996641 RepID=A0A561BVS4_9ACTN|nr:GNAT family N-acetyltransferase [Kribbella amoyensis]TWD82933.1 FR47-like protein [Kribbella amoyensis]